MPSSTWGVGGALHALTHTQHKRERETETETGCVFTSLLIAFPGPGQPTHLVCRTAGAWALPALPRAATTCRRIDVGYCYRPFTVINIAHKLV